MIPSPSFGPLDNSPKAHRLLGNCFFTQFNGELKGQIFPDTIIAQEEIDDYLASKKVAFDNGVVESFDEKYERQQFRVFPVVSN